jgi:hypothetical protein
MKRSPVKEVQQYFKQYRVSPQATTTLHGMGIMSPSDLMYLQDSDLETWAGRIKGKSHTFEMTSTEARPLQGRLCHMQNLLPMSDRFQQFTTYRYHSGPKMKGLQMLISTGASTMSGIYARVVDNSGIRCEVQVINFKMRIVRWRRITRARQE